MPTSASELRTGTRHHSHANCYRESADARPPLLERAKPSCAVQPRAVPAARPATPDAVSTLIKCWPVSRSSSDAAAHPPPARRPADPCCRGCSGAEQACWPVPFDVASTDPPARPGGRSSSNCWLRAGQVWNYRVGGIGPCTRTGHACCPTQVRTEHPSGAHRGPRWPTGRASRAGHRRAVCRGAGRHHPAPGWQEWSRAGRDAECRSRLACPSAMGRLGLHSGDTRLMRAMRPVSDPDSAGRRPTATRPSAGTPGTGAARCAPSSTCR